MANNSKTILSQNTRPETGPGFNGNVMVIGGPGSGKKRSMVLPNLLQADRSYVVTDPSGELCAETGNFFESQGYDIQVLNFIDPEKSNTYNPFIYMHDENDMDAMLSCITGDDGDPFLGKMEETLLKAVIHYLRRYQPPKNQNFAMVSKLLRQAKVDPKQAKSQLDAIFDEVRGINKEDICMKYYDIFKQASVKTQQKVIALASARFMPFGSGKGETLTSSNEIQLETLADRKTIIYVIMPQGSNSYAPLANMLYLQASGEIIRNTRENSGKEPKYNTRFILSEFVNCGRIPDFCNRISVGHRYGISYMPFIQAIGQLKTLYKDEWETIIGACDGIVYLGGHEINTIRFLQQYPSESCVNLMELGDDECAVRIKGHTMSTDKKYALNSHPNAKCLGNLADGSNIYTIPYNNKAMSDKGALEAKRKKIQERIARKSAASDGTTTTDNI